MRGMTQLDLRRSLIVLIVAFVFSGCATGPEVCKRDAITGSEQCQTTSGNYGEAAATAGIATGSWAAVGCTVNGCEPPYTCNADSKQCVPMHCKSDVDCKGYNCDMESERCR